MTGDYTRANYKGFVGASDCESSSSMGFVDHVYRAHKGNVLHPFTSSYQLELGSSAVDVRAE